MRVFFLVFAIVLCACGSHDTSSAPAIVPGAPAGDVTEISGDVHATRDGKPRALAKGDVVSGDDVIATGADGRVTIVLRHNQVPWSLGPNKEKKVGDSAAWAAAKGAAPEGVSDDKSGAAGRHAERSAADTTQTSGGGSGSAVAAGSGSGSANPNEEAERLEAEEKLAQLQKERSDMEAREEEAKAAAERVERKKGVTISKECLDNPLAKGCEGGGDERNDMQKPGGGGNGDVEGGIDPAVIRRVFQARAGSFKACFVQVLKTNPKASGKIKLRITIGTDGKVSQAEVDGDDALAPMFDCVIAQAKKLVFPKPESELKVSYPFVFSAQ
ncbi:MAG TPA: AgmX/PglI C-terminal domain-containing protein [Kofleriaceae bacterium]|nr:AgmX/PglI C-terminal domain-containing protein [Kofleriaceae bacterium]